MCGITGVVSPVAGKLASIHAMTASLTHRGPDFGDVIIDEPAGMAFGHRRLAILDLSPLGRQPMISICSRYTLVFNGEIYNHLELRQRLALQAAIVWRGSSDTETLLEAFARWGVKRTLNEIKGMFAIALWDQQLQQLTLARDRLGEKPLYYGDVGESFVFASEVKAITRFDAFNAEIDQNALAAYFQFNYVPSPYSIYKGIYKLAPGCMLTMSRAEGTSHRNIQPYWRLSRVVKEGMRSPLELEEPELLMQLESKLATAVRSQLMSDVPIGALLSGGVDSSLICALAQKHSATQLKTFSVGFNEAQMNEAHYAAAVANHLGTDHTELTISPQNLLDWVPNISQVYDEPFADSSQLPTYFVMKLVSQHVTVALSGDGGDESFAGYNRYQFASAIWNRFSSLPLPLRSILTSMLSRIDVVALNRISTAFKVSQLGDKVHKVGRKLVGADSFDDFYLNIVSEWNANDILNDALRSTDCLPLLHNRRQWQPTGDQISDMMYLDAMTYMPDDILVKVDRAAMANSLETRAPFLDKDLIEFAWRIPQYQKMKGGESKYLLKKLLVQHVPKSLVNRPKMGFAIPLDDWLRGPLRQWAGDMLSSHRLRASGLLNDKMIQVTFEKHLARKANYGYRLWSVLMFVLWFENTKLV